MRRSVFVGAALAGALCSCGDDGHENYGDAGYAYDSGVYDAGLDGGHDGGIDGGQDGGEDAGIDAGHDAGAEAGLQDSGTGEADSGSDAGADAGTADAGTESFAAIYSDIIMPICSGCHRSVNPTGALDMSTVRKAFDDLVDQQAAGPACGSSNLERVVPGNSAMSLLVQKLAGTQTCGSQMPLNGTPLSADQIDRIRRWIDQGAHDN